MQEKPWFKDATIYELHVRAFCDSNADGIGDFRGLTSKLPYFEDLGVTALWLLPFYPSPLRDDGYDIAEYCAVNPAYGTLDDFKEFLEGAHRHHLKVITELVINHTSDQHKWFKRARLAPAGSPERDFYVWSDDPRRYEGVRIIFKDFESSNWAWDPVAKAYYWHRFYSHQPDLNFESAPVREAVIEVLDFWMDMGIDGLRLDAIPYLFEREGTSCENLPETHAYLSELRRHVDEKYPECMLLAEANQWPEDAVQYFGTGNECHMAFHFPLMPRLFMGIQMEDRFPIIDILEQTPEIPAGCQWAIFLRNHDELTLEMVTDEERDYMYRLYAEDPRARINLGIRRRLAPLLDNNRRKIELINSLLLSLPGTPIIYYGDEIGMGDNFYLGDRNGVRTPMQWSSDRNAGFSLANPQQLFLPVIIDPEFHYEAVNVDVQQKNLSSLFWWMRRLIEARKRHRVFSTGSIEFLRPTNAKVLAFLRKDGADTVLVIANLSRFSQALSLDLSSYKGCRAKELFSGGDFLEITERPVFLTIGPHSFYWLSLTQAAGAAASFEESPPSLAIPSEWSDELRERLEREILPGYLAQCRWFGHKQRPIRSLRITQEFEATREGFRILFIEVAFPDGDAVTQVVPVGIGREDEGDSTTGTAVIARFGDGKVLWDALSVPDFRARLWELMDGSKPWAGTGAELWGALEPSAKQATSPSSRVLGGEQSNTTLVYEEKLLLKFLRKFEVGPHPDAEIVRVLGQQGFPHVPRFAGEIRCRMGNEDGAVALMTSYVKNDGDGWTYTLDALSRVFERVLGAQLLEGEPDTESILGTNYPRRARQLGERTGALHRVLDQIPDNPAFAPEPFNPHAQRSLYQTLRSNLRRIETELGNKLSSLEANLQEQARTWIASVPRILDFYASLLKRRLTATKIRVHGDYHLGQVLNVGNDFVILDFEGEPRRTLGERRLKRSALVDVAGMLRSFDYAAEASLLREKPEDLPRLRPWTDRWLAEVSQAFLAGYREAATGGSFLPSSDEDFDFLVHVFLLDKAVYEIGYELNYRPSFLAIPINAASRLLGEHGVIAPQA